MTLDEFVAKLRSDVDRFEADWRKNAKKNPENYPMKFPADDAGAWWEQFTAFMGEY